MCHLYNVPKVPTAKYFICSIELLTTFYLSIYLNFIFYMYIYKFCILYIYIIYLQNFVFVLF